MRMACINQLRLAGITCIRLQTEFSLPGYDPRSVLPPSDEAWDHILAAHLTAVALEQAIER